MANIKSQIKRNKQNELRRQRNQSVRSRLKTSIRKFRELAASGDKEAAAAAARDAQRELDKAASKGVIHKNQAANSMNEPAREPNGPSRAELRVRWPVHHRAAHFQRR